MVGPHDRQVSVSTDGQDVASGELELVALRARVLDLERFIARLGHELTTPLTTISGFASLLSRNDALDEGTADALSRIQSSADRAGRTLRGIVDETRLDRAESTSITNLLDDAVREVAGEGAPIEFERPVSAARVFCHRAVARRLFVAAITMHLERATGPLVLEATILEAERGDTVSVRLDSHGPTVTDEERAALEGAMAFEAEGSVRPSVAALVRAARLAATQAGRVWLDEGTPTGIGLTVSLPRSTAVEG